MYKSVVSLSGGLDSAANLAMAQSNFEVLLAINFDYGHRAQVREEQCSRLLAKHYDVPLQTVNVRFFKDFHSGLLDGEIPLAQEVDIHSREASERTAKMVWVPNRNGIFLNIAAGYAEQLGASKVFVGFNREEAETFADNSEEFLNSLTRSLAYSTRNAVHIESTTVTMTKIEMVDFLKGMDFPFSMIWSCYQNGEKWCGECESCQRLNRALSANGLSFEKLRDENAALLARQ